MVLQEEKSVLNQSVVFPKFAPNKGKRGGGNRHGMTRCAFCHMTGLSDSDSIFRTSNKRRTFAGRIVEEQQFTQGAFHERFFTPFEQVLISEQI
jgi:hypothetical protein